MMFEAYIADLKRKFYSKEIFNIQDNVKIRGYNIIMISDVKEWNYFDGCRSFIYILNFDKYKIDLYSLKVFCNTLRHHTNRILGTNRLLRLRAGVTIPLLVSEYEYPEPIIKFVKNTKMFKLGDLCMPVLVDLSKGEVTTLEHFGFVGALPIRKKVKRIKQDFSVDIA